jgi:hypothetical protein
MKIIERGNNSPSLALCPICESDLIHINEVQASIPDDTVGGYRTEVIHMERLDSNPFDGSENPPIAENTSQPKVSLIGWCENCGETFNVTFSQYKGNTFVRTSQMNKKWVDIPVKE